MIFIDDIDLVGENLEKINIRLDEWRLTFEGIGFRISRNKKRVYRVSHWRKILKS